MYALKLIGLGVIIGIWLSIWVAVCVVAVQNWRADR